MLKRIQNLIEDQKLLNRFARALKPSQKAEQKAKQAFLAEISKEFGASPIAASAHSKTQATQSPYFSYFSISKITTSKTLRYAAFVLIGILALNGGAVIYADTTDVPATHPLYQYKRVAEQVELAIVPVEKKPEVQAKIAKRRDDEYKKILAIQTDIDAKNTTSLHATSTIVASSSASTSISISSAATTTLSKRALARKAKTLAIQRELREEVKKQVNDIENSLKKVSSDKRTLKVAAVCSNLQMIKLESSLDFADATTTLETNTKIKELCAVITDPTNLDTDSSTSTKDNAKILEKINKDKKEEAKKSSSQKKNIQESITEAGKKLIDGVATSSTNIQINIQKNSGTGNVESSSKTIIENIQNTNHIEINVKPKSLIP